MKQFIMLFFIVISLFGIELVAQNAPVEKDIRDTSTSVTSSPQTEFDRALSEYSDKNYKKAVEILESEIKISKEKGEVSSELFYNLGNAYFRMNDFAEAMLSYERALLYNPGDRDIKHNIEYTQTKIEDKILTADNFFLKIWFDGVLNLLSSDSWAIVAISFFVIFIVSLFLFFFSPSLVLKKFGFYGGVVFFICLIFANIFSIKQKSKIESRDTAIVMKGSAPVVSSPSESSKDLFTLHSGTKVEILKEDGDWYEIEIANGNVGWVQKDIVEII